MAVSDSESKEVQMDDKGSESSAANVVSEAPEQLSSSSIEATPKLLEETPAETEEKPTIKGVKRRASDAFSEEFDEDFKGFSNADQDDSLLDCSRINQLLGRIEEEKTALSKDIVSIKTVTIAQVARAVKRPRKDTDGSRPSSGLSSKSEAESVLSDAARITSPAPASRDMSSPLFLVPINKGWKREVVHRAVFDQHSRRPCDIYYYTPQGKKLRSMKEIGDYLMQNKSTGLSTENFTFFKEPLGLNDPEKEIIRLAKFIQRTESPSSSPSQFTPKEGKRTPKPKLPKGATPEPILSPPTKIKVKSLGSRLSTSSPSVTTPKRKKSTTLSDNTEWKKPRLVLTAREPPPPPPPLPPPPLQCKPPELPHHAPPDSDSQPQHSQCSLGCRRGVPNLSCSGCLCMYHPACVGFATIPPPETFLCKNCSRSNSPPLEPPPLTHKSGVTASTISIPSTSRTKQLPLPGKMPAVKGDKRVTLKMKVAGGGPDGERVWAVAKPPPLPTPRPVPQITRPMLPQSIALINGRKFIVVRRDLMPSTDKPKERRVTRTKLTNGTVTSPAINTSVQTTPKRRAKAKADDTDRFLVFYNKSNENKDSKYNVLEQIFQYLGMRDLAHCARVSKLWKELASMPTLWRHVRMKNSHVSDWNGLCSSLKRHGTKRLDLRKMLLPQNDINFWEQFAKHIGTVSTLERIEMCRCPASAVEALCRSLPNLKSLSALAIRDTKFEPTTLGRLLNLEELRLKSMSGLSLSSDLTPLSKLKHLQHLSLTSIKELGWCACDVVGSLSNLETLELGECTFRAEFGSVLAKLTRLKRLRLERGTSPCSTPALLRSLSNLPLLTRLELVNVDVKVGFDEALGECKNIQRLLIIPTYVSQSATTNKQVLSGILRLKDTLTHLMWGVTIELLRVTELFIDQCEQSQQKNQHAVPGESKKKDIGECIPVLKPVPGCKLPEEHHNIQGPPQVEILPLPTLQRLLSAQLPNTKVKLLRIPFHATWRQSLADFQ